MLDAKDAVASTWGRVSKWPGSRIRRDILSLVSGKA